jgi:hypothetical protein
MMAIKARHFAANALLGIGVVLLGSGCAATKLSPGAEKILVTRQPAPKTCKFRGQVLGEQGGMLTGGWTSNKNLAQGAMNDMRNKAAEVGANYVVLEESKAGNTFSRGGVSMTGGQTDVTQIGNAYLCPAADIGMDG